MQYILLFFSGPMTRPYTMSVCRIFRYFLLWTAPGWWEATGKLHQGVFDLSYLSMIPNMTVMSPKNRWEMADMVRFAVDFQYPIALRYPRGDAYEGMRQFRSPIEYGKCEILYEEEDIAVFFVGHMAELADSVRLALKDAGYSCSLVNARFVKPIDTAGAGRTGRRSQPVCHNRGERAHRRLRLSDS